MIADDGSDPYGIGSPAPEHFPDPPNVWALHPLAVAAANATWQGNPARSFLALPARPRPVTTQFYVP